MGTVDYPISLLTWDVVFLGGAAVGAIICRQTFNWKWLAAGFVMFNMNIALVLNFFGFNDIFYALAGRPDVAFNWAGKIAALSFSLILLASPWFDRYEAGVTLRQAKGARIGWIAFGILIAINAIVVLQIPNEPQNSEAIAYQLLMPSLDEEIFFRGVLLIGLVKAFGEGPRFPGANIGWGALMSSLMFGLIHGLFWTDSGWFVSVEDLLFAGLIGLFLTWLRLNTGSVVAPILLHSAVNTLWRLM